MKYITDTCTKALSKSIKKTTNDHTQTESIYCKAVVAANILTTLNETFRKAYKAFSHCNAMPPSKITEVESMIKNYMWFYRKHMKYRVFPKLHFLETHCMEWLKRYPFGMGLFSEQGSESIHKNIRILELTCHGIPDIKRRMTSVFNNHLNQVCPHLIEHFPKIKRHGKRIKKGKKKSKSK